VPNANPILGHVQRAPTKEAVIHILDIIVFVTATLGVLVIGIIASRRRKTARDFFLAGGSLRWYQIGGSIIAANISSHHFIGFAGIGFGIGLAQASYEWGAILAIIMLAVLFLPMYLQTKITTISEFLEKRFDYRSRIFYSGVTMLGYIVIELTGAIYLGSLAAEAAFGISYKWGILFIAMFAGFYATVGGLRAIVWTNMVQILILIVAGLILTFITVSKAGGLFALMEADPGKWDLLLPANHPDLPWTGIFTGLVVLNIGYWSINQFIVQSALGAKTDLEGRNGVIFGGFLKLLVPVISIIPGIAAGRLLTLERADMVMPTLIQEFLPIGLKGLVLAGLLGAIVSTVDMLLNASSTMFTYDFYKRFFRKAADDRELKWVGRLVMFIILMIAILAAPTLRNAEYVFLWMTSTWAYIKPGIVAAFVIGVFWKGANRMGGFAALLASIPVSIALELWVFPGINFLNRCGIAFVICCAFIWGVSMLTKKYSWKEGEKYVWNRSYLAVSMTGTLAGDEGERGEIATKIPLHMDYRMWSGLLLLIVIMLYIWLG
jgi:solute:Na+ symporter, SSS family